MLDPENKADLKYKDLPRVMLATGDFSMLHTIAGLCGFICVKIPRARKMGAKGFDFSNASEIMDEIASLTPSYGGISFDRLENGGLQWPCPSPDHPGTKFLHK